MSKITITLKSNKSIKLTEEEYKELCSLLPSTINYPTPIYFPSPSYPSPNYPYITYSNA